MCNRLFGVSPPSLGEVAIQKKCMTGCCGLQDCALSFENVLKSITIIFFFQKGSDVSCPLQSADFINEIEQIMTQRFHAKTEHDCREPDCKYSVASGNCPRVPPLVTAVSHVTYGCGVTIGKCKCEL